MEKLLKCRSSNTMVLYLFFRRNKMALWNVRVWCMTASYNYRVEASNADIAKRAVKSQVMPDMKHWNFSTRLADEDDIGKMIIANDNNN